MTGFDAWSNGRGGWCNSVAISQKFVGVGQTFAASNDYNSWRRLHGQWGRHDGLAANHRDIRRDRLENGSPSFKQRCGCRRLLSGSVLAPHSSCLASSPYKIGQAYWALATRRALDLLRRRRHGLAIGQSLGEVSELEGRSMPPPAAAEELELFEQLREGLALLPSDQAEVCCLRFLESLSYEQIAAELDVTVNHVGVLLHCAKVSLQNRLAAFAPVSRGEREVIK